MRGSIIQRSPGSWTLVFDMGRDGQGRRRQKWKTVRGTKADAELPRQLEPQGRIFVRRLREC